MKEPFGWNSFLVNDLALLIEDSETLRNSGILSVLLNQLLLIADRGCLEQG